MVVTDQKIYYLILEDGGRTEMHIIDQDEVEQEIREELQAQFISPDQWLQTWPYNRDPDDSFAEMGNRLYEQAVEKSREVARQAASAIKEGHSGYLATVPVPEWGVTASVAVESTKDVFDGQDDKGIAKCIDSQISNIIFGGTPRQRTSVFADVRPEAFSRLVREMIGLLIESD